MTLNCGDIIRKSIMCQTTDLHYVKESPRCVSSINHCFIKLADFEQLPGLKVIISEIFIVIIGLIVTHITNFAFYWETFESINKNKRGCCSGAYFFPLKDEKYLSWF